MRTIIKWLLLASVILIVSGCDAEYNISVKKDLSVGEEVIFLEDNDYIISAYPSINSYLEALRFQASEDPTLHTTNYTLTNIKNKNNSGVKAEHTYDDFSSFVANTLLINKIFEKMTMDTNGNLVTLYGDSINSPYNIFIGTELDGPQMNHLTINIKVPYNVVNHNADKVDKMKNIYTWNYNKSTAYKDINIVFDQNKVFKITLFDKIAEYFRNFDKKNFYYLIPVGAIVIVIAFLAIKNKKINEL